MLRTCHNPCIERKSKDAGTDSLDFNLDITQNQVPVVCVCFMEAILENVGPMMALLIEFPRFLSRASLV